MRRIGFSTGALTKGDFEKGIRLQEAVGRVNALELSVLRERELEPLLNYFPDIDRNKFEYVSLHSPSKRERLSERELVEKLNTIATYFDAIVVHPDIIEDPTEWRLLGSKIALENMDQRKPCARTARELRPFFDALPDAQFCFDIGHARQVDPTLSIAVDLLKIYDERLVEIHISEVDAFSKHVPISSVAMNSYRRISSLIPRDVPVILESSVSPDSIAEEIHMALRSLGDMAGEPVHSAAQTAM
jgi:hypothetical protein